MNRYKSSQKWRKVKAGWYQSPDGKYDAWRRKDGRWRLAALDLGMWRVRPEGDWKELNVFLTLADCQEHAERLERGDASV